jgi:hypothetical protein
LHNVATRPAQIEDKLVTTKFSNSITRGFAAIGATRGLWKFSWGHALIFRTVPSAILREATP